MISLVKNTKKCLRLWITLNIFSFFSAVSGCISTSAFASLGGGIFWLGGGWVGVIGGGHWF